MARGRGGWPCRASPEISPARIFTHRNGRARMRRGNGRRSAMDAEGNARGEARAYAEDGAVVVRRAFVENGPGAAVARRLMGSEGARFFHDHVLVKEPGTSLVTPWHQDSPYYCIAGDQTV